MMFELLHYQAEAGTDEYQEWLDGLRDVSTRVRITRVVDRMRQGNFGDHKFCRDGVWELRLNFGPGYRVYYGMDGDAVVLLLCGGDKSTQDRDIERAVAFLRDYNRRKR